MLSNHCFVSAECARTLARRYAHRVAAGLALWLCASVSLQAQSLKRQGTSASGIVPSEWEYQEATGDLNKDGIADLVVVATPNFKEYMKARDDGFVYNFNQPLLAVYFGVAQGGFLQWKEYDKVIPARPDEYNNADASLEITERGTLRIAVSEYSDMGSYGTTQTTCTYRFQNGDFYLIGKDVMEASRSTGSRTVTSENYLTWKRQVVTDDLFDESVSPTERWSNLPRTRLHKLGEEAF